MNQLTRTLISTSGCIAFTLVSATSLAEQRQWDYQYNAHGQVVLADGPRTDVDDSMHYSYDAAGNRSTATNALGHVTRMLDHNEQGQPGRLIDANGTETRLSYHPRGWISSRTVVSPSGDSALDATTRYTYDAEGLLLSTTLPDGTTIFNEYDAAQRLIAVSNGSGERVEYTLDQAGNRLAQKSYNSSGSLVRDINQQFDELNRLIEVSGAAGQVDRYSYDRNGNRSSHTDGNGNIRVFYPDALDRTASSEAAYDHRVQYRYDRRDNLVEVTDPRGLGTRYTLNGFDELVTLDSPDTGISHFLYDSAGNRILSTDARGSTATYTYDALNRPLQASFPDSELDITYGYDAGNFGKGRLSSVNDASGLTQLDYDHRGNLLLESRSVDGHEFTLAYTYNLANRVTRITYPSGRTVDYSYDAEGRQESIHTSGPEGSRSIVTDARYLPFGPATSLNMGNGLAMNAAYDLDYRLSSLSYGNTFSRSYSYDPAGNITGIDDLRNSALSQALGYDALNRLGTASGSYGNISYSYDANSNRLTRSSGAGTDGYSYDSGSNRLLATSNWNYQYDANGNLSARTDLTGSNSTLYQYDARNRLARVIHRQSHNGEAVDTLLASYSYNFRNQRTRKQTANEDIHYIYGQAGELLAEINAEGIALREYIYFNGRPVAVANARLTYGPSQPGPEILMDDTSAGTSSSGEWEQVRKKGAYGDYYHLSEDAGKRFRWHPGTLEPHDYELYAWWPKKKKNNPNASYQVHHNGQVSTVIVDQGSQGKQWVYLGTYQFNGSGDEYIELSDAGGRTAADGIRLVEILPPPPPVISTEIYYIHTDHLGTPQTLTNQAQNVVWNANYQPFGKADINVAAITNNLRFPGQYFDSESGLHYNYFRDYDSSLGRYIQSDPIGLLGGPNTYVYSINNPIRFSDTNGLIVWTGTSTTVSATQGIGASITRFRLTSQGVDGKTATVQVTAVGPSLGFGSNLGATRSKVKFNDGLNFINPDVFSGKFEAIQIGITVPFGPGYGATAINLGDAGSIGHGQIDMGYDASITITKGSATVTDVSWDELHSCP